MVKEEKTLRQAAAETCCSCAAGWRLCLVRPTDLVTLKAKMLCRVYKMEIEEVKSSIFKHSLCVLFVLLSCATVADEGNNNMSSVGKWDC